MVATTVIADGQCLSPLEVVGVCHRLDLYRLDLPSPLVNMYAGMCEDDLLRESDYEGGDGNGDRDFDTTDLIFAMKQECMDSLRTV